MNSQTFKKLFLGLLVVAAIAPFKAKADEENRTELLARLYLPCAYETEEARRLEALARIEAAQDQAEQEVEQGRQEIELILTNS